MNIVFLAFESGAGILPAGAEKWLTLAVLVFIVISLFKDFLSPALTFFAGVLTLTFFGAVSPGELLGSFSNQQVATIVLLILITATMNKNYDVEAFFDRLFAGVSRPKPFLLRMSVYVSVISSFVNNTPVVAFMTPYVYNWCKKFGTHPSKLLIPLSFSTILGGMITVIGTSTNLVLNGFLAENGIATLGIADFMIPGVAVTVTGIAYLYFFGYKLLPENREAFDNVKAKAPEYLIETEVENGSKLVGQELANSVLLSQKGVYLIELHRGGEVVSPVPRHEKLEGGDLLLFMGKSETVLELVNAGIGLRLPRHNDALEIVEAVIPANSGLSGVLVGASGLKQKYGAEVVAIHRNGEKISGKMEDKHFSQGDMLLLSVDETFMAKSESSKDLYVLSKVKQQRVPNPFKLKAFLIATALIVALAFLGLFNTFTAALYIVTAALLLKMLSFRDIQKELDLDLVVILVSALTLGNAMIKTGASDIVGGSFISLFYPLGNTGILVGLFILTVALTSFITNVAAVSISFPIAYSVSVQLGLDGTPFYLAIAFAASAAFLTPIGYQTNWMVFGPGNYKAKDFLKVGLPLSIVYALTSITVILLRHTL